MDVSENSQYNSRSLSEKRIGNLPQINNKGGVKYKSPLRENSTLAKFNKSYLAMSIQNQNDQKFQPPNITFFKQAEVGPKGSLFNAQNERMNAEFEANIVENRVKVLLKEEERMIKKIDEARRQAQKMIEMKEMQNERYLKMVEFKIKKEADEEAQRQKNQFMKQNMGKKYQERKEEMFKTNRDGYLTIRSQRKNCLDEKNLMMANHIDQQQQKFNQQKQLEIRLKQMLENNKINQQNQNKSRYDIQTNQNKNNQSFHSIRMREASEKEEALMARLKNTMNEQRQVLNELQNAIQQNQIKKSERVSSVVDIDELRKKRINDVIISTKINHQKIHSSLH